jgi:NADPH2:quinone reductase
MKAALVHRYGGPETIEIGDIAEPRPGPGEVLVKVAAAALNFFDTLIIRNKYQRKPPLPFSPCGEIAGFVESVGEGVTGLAPGDRVAAYIGWNGAREKVNVPAAQAVRIPNSVSLDVAAGISITYGTGMHGLKDRGRLKAGETLAVLGAAGGAGLAAVEIGKRLGARVIALASSADKLAVAKAHGADEGINYDAEDVKEGLRRLTGGDGVDVVYDCVGDRYAEPALRALAWEGRYVVVGFAGGNIPSPPLNLVLLKGSEITGVFWGEFARRNPERNRAHTEEVLSWIVAGLIKPHVHSIYPLERIAEAIGAIERREAVGKVVIRLA